jgi:hypothetical protein
VRKKGDGKGGGWGWDIYAWRSSPRDHDRCFFSDPVTEFKLEPATSCSLEVGAEQGEKGRRGEEGKQTSGEGKKRGRGRGANELGRGGGREEGEGGRGLVFDAKSFFLFVAWVGHRMGLIKLRENQG